MIQIKDLPNISTSFEKLKIIIDLQQRADIKTSLGAGIINAIQKKVPKDEIIKMLQDCITDNRLSVCLVIGEELVNRIADFKL